MDVDELVRVCRVARGEDPSSFRRAGGAGRVPGDGVKVVGGFR